MPDIVLEARDTVVYKKKKKILCLTLKAFFLVGMINKKINKLETGIKQWQVQ